MHTTSFQTPYYDGHYSYFISFTARLLTKDLVSSSSVTNDTKADLLSLISGTFLIGQRNGL